jgi:surfactin family lipopeptide synthetase C
MANARDIEDIYPLSPMQRGILFDTLFDPDSAVYFEQAGQKIDGPVNLAALRTAWQMVIDRHPSLRTAVVYKIGKDPFQVVCRARELPWREVDLRGMPPRLREEVIRRCLDSDRRRGFIVSNAPMIRVAIFRLDQDTVYFTWSHHHLILDGWSTSLVLREVFTIYGALLKGTLADLPLPRPYRDYIAWLGRQDQTGAERHWRKKLEGFSRPTIIRADAAGTPGTGHGELKDSIPYDLVDELRDLCKSHRLTPFTFFKGAWGALLSGYSGDQDIVFGTVVAGRPPELRGNESMIGVFFNVLPVRVCLAPGLKLVEWLLTLQADDLESRQFEYISLVDIQGWSTIPRSMRVFDTVLIYENYSGASSSRLNRSTLHQFERSSVPITAVIEPGDTFDINLRYDRTILDQPAALGMVTRFKTILRNMIDYSEGDVSSLSVTTDEEAGRLAAAFSADF